MKIKRNIMIATIFIFVWSLLVVIEVKVANFELLKYIYFLTFPLIVVGFVWANKSLIENERSHLGIEVLNYALGIIISVIFILIGIMLVTNLKLLIGGSI